MENDRAETNLGVADIQAEEVSQPRQPKKRFVGRRQAAENAAKNGASLGIEDSGAIQGMKSLRIYRSKTDPVHSRSTTKNRKNFEPSAPRNIERRSYQRCYRFIAIQLFLRNSQDHPSNPHEWLQESRPSNARGSFALCNYHIRYPYTILSWDRDADYGRCHIRRMLY